MGTEVATAGSCPQSLVLAKQVLDLQVGDVLPSVEIAKPLSREPFFSPLRPWCTSIRKTGRVRRPDLRQTRPTSEMRPEPAALTVPRGVRPRGHQVSCSVSATGASGRRSVREAQPRVLDRPRLSTRGQASLIQVAPTSSSRSAAQRMDTCSIQPIWCRMRQVCAWLMRTWKRLAITLAGAHRWSSTQPDLGLSGGRNDRQRQSRLGRTSAASAS